VHVKDQWYCGVDGQQYGPYTWEQLRAMAAEGRIVTETYIRREIDQQWRSAAQVPGLLARKKPALKKPAAPGGGNGQAGQSDSQSLAAVGATPTTTATGTASVTAKKPKIVKAVPVAAATAAPPVQPTGSIPVGQPVASVSPAAPVGVAVSVSPAPSSAPPAFAFNTGAPSKASAEADDEVAPARKKSPLVLVAVLGGVALAIAVIGVAVVAWSWSQPPSPGDDQIADADPVAEIPSEPPVEANPGLVESNPGVLNPASVNSSSAAAGKTEAGKAKASSMPAAASAGQLSGKSLAEAQKVISAQPRWGNIETYSIKINDVHVKVISAWLAADTSGKFVQPKLPDAAPADSAGSELAVSSEAGKFVFVEVRLHNGGKVPRKFRSWNAAESLAAVMADEQGNVLAPVPATATPGVTRQTSLRLLPDQSVTDTLVFHAPQGTFESLKLALAQSAIAETSKRHIAFSVPVEVMFKKQGEPDQARGGGPVAANRGPLADGENSSPKIAETDPPAGAPDKPAEKPAEKPADDKPKIAKPPTKEELNKQFEDFDKPPPKDDEKDASKEAAQP
jgi:hypothetical protein